MEIKYSQEIYSEFVARFVQPNVKLAFDLMFLIEALESIAKNNCCDSCQEAKLVALNALDKLYVQSKD